MPAKETASGGEDEIDEAGVEVGFYGNGLELDDVLREVVLLALPMQIVLRRGLQGDLSDLRAEPQSAGMSLPDGDGGRPVEQVKEICGPRWPALRTANVRNKESTCQIPNAAIRSGVLRRAVRTMP